MLFGLFNGVIAGFDGAASKMSDMRLRVTNRANILEAMPIAYEDAHREDSWGAHRFVLRDSHRVLPGSEERFERDRWTSIRRWKCLPKCMCPPSRSRHAQHALGCDRRVRPCETFQLENRRSHHVALDELDEGRRLRGMDVPNRRTRQCRAETTKKCSRTSCTSTTNISTQRASTVKERCISSPPRSTTRAAPPRSPRRSTSDSRTRARKRTTMNEREYLVAQIRQIGNVRMFVN